MLILKNKNKVIIRIFKNRKKKFIYSDKQVNFRKK